MAAMTSWKVPSAFASFADGAFPASPASSGRWPNVVGPFSNHWQPLRSLHEGPQKQHLGCLESDWRGNLEQGRRGIHRRGIFQAASAVLFWYLLARASRCVALTQIALQSQILNCDAVRAMNLKSWWCQVPPPTQAQWRLPLLCWHWAA